MVGPFFTAQSDLLDFFLDHRDVIVDGIQEVLNAQRKPLEYLQNRLALARQLEECFFSVPGITPSQSRLRGQLEEVHGASGFKPRDMPGVHNGLIDPAEILTRAFYLWRQTRWPGRNGRIRYANTLFNLYVMRCLEFLSLRLWDPDTSGAGERLAALQHLLDQLWATSPAGQPVLVRDARWLIQLAQSPATDDLGAYFAVAGQIADTLPTDDRLEIHKAGVRMAAGHLRSQLRYRSTKLGVRLDEHSLTLSTRNSNALDFALLIQELVPLLEAYEHACEAGDDQTRLALADAICQGVSPDPELFLNRVDLLGAYSMIEHLFVTTADDDVVYTPMGRRHVRLVEDYAARIGRVSRWLLADCQHFRPVEGACSPYGVLYGFSSHLIEHMALKASQLDAPPAFSLEDVFVAGDVVKRAWVSGWRQLPHLSREVLQQFEYPQSFAEAMFERIERALGRCAAVADADITTQTGRLFIVPQDSPSSIAGASSTPELPASYVYTSDDQLIAAHEASPCDERHLLNERREGKFILSYKTPRGWVAISKDILTDVVGTGRDVRISGLPTAAAEALMLMCPGCRFQPTPGVGSGFSRNVR